MRDDIILDSGLPHAEDLPRTRLPDEPFWSESFGHWGYFPAEKLGLFFHLQRQVERKSLWREVVVIQRGGEDVVVAKSYGSRPDGAPGANGLVVTCVEPFKSWRVMFDGAARVVPAGRLYDAELCDGVHHPVRMSLRLDAFAPVWAMGRNANAESWGRAHYEQGVRISGELEVRGEVTRVDGLGWRDHSYGPRDFAHLSGAQWMHGQFASSRCFLAMYSDPNATGPRFEAAFVAEAGTLYPATLRTVPVVKAPSPGDTALIELDYSGRTARIECRYLHAVPVSLAGVNEQVIGRIGGAEGWSKLYYDTHLRYVWDGEVGHGCANPTLVRSVDRHGA